MQDLINTKNNSTNHPAFKEDEYVVVKFHPGCEFTFCVFRTGDYREAYEHLLNLLNSPYTLFNNAPSRAFYVVKKFHQQGLYPVTEGGEINWELVDDTNSRWVKTSYQPNVYSSHQIQKSVYNYQTLVTASADEIDSRHQDFESLVQEHPRVINQPTEKDAAPIENNFKNNVTITTDNCLKCHNYHGKTYNGNKLICAMHPCGYEGDSCLDYSPSKNHFDIFGLLKKILLLD